MLGVTLAVDLTSSFDDIDFTDLQVGEVLEAGYVREADRSYFADEAEREEDDDDDD